MGVVVVVSCGSSGCGWESRDKNDKSTSRGHYEYLRHDV